MTMKIQLIRNGERIQSTRVAGGEVAQIKTRRSFGDWLTGRSAQIAIFGDGDPRIDSAGQIHRFAPDGKTALALGTDALGEVISSHNIRVGRTLSFAPRAGVDVSILLQAGPGELPNPPAQVYDRLGPIKFGDIVKIVASHP